MTDKCTRDQLAAFKKALEWTPLILGDGTAVGSLCQKYFCEKCKTMLLTDGQWPFFERAIAKK
eukprot:9469345-Karenia_brevis.AAC.1